MILLGKSLTAILRGSGGASTFAALTDKATADMPAINTPLATALDTKEATSNKKTDVDANKTSNTFFPTVKAVFDWVSGLFVKGAASSTDEALVRWDGTTGKLLQNSEVVIGDDGGIVQNSPSVAHGMTLIAPTTSYLQALPITAAGGGGQVFGLSGSDTVALRLYGIGTDCITNPAVQFLVGKKNSNSWQPLAASNKLLEITNYTTVLTTTLGNGDTGFGATPTAKLDVNGTSRFRGDATFNGQIIDNVGSSGADGQVLKKVGGLVIWANP